MSKSITTDQIKKLAEEFNIDYKLIQTVFIVESSGSGFDKNTGLIKIQFEPHKFKKYTNIDILNGIEGQAKEWEAFNRACCIDAKAAKLATSWGLGQVLGENYGLAGYISVDKMVNEFNINEYYQLKGMINFIVNTGIIKYLKAKDWHNFAMGYNGKKYKLYSNPPYNEKLKTAYEKLSTKKLED